MYFSNFQKVWYDIDNSKKYQVVTNVLQRVAFRKRVKNEGDLFIQYQLKDTDRPDIIADKIYGSSKLHWIVLLFNDYINPYHEWVKPTETLEKVIKNKYKGFPLFVWGTDSEPLESDVDRNYKFWNWNVGDAVEYIRDDGTTPTVIGTAKVLSTDKTLHKVVVDNIDVLVDSNEFSPPNDGASYYVRKQEGVSSPGGGIAGTLRANKIIKAVQVHEQSVHHFEKDGVILNPLASLEGETYTGDIYAPVPIPFESTLLWSYMNDAVNAFKDFVSIEQSEINDNEDQRAINLLRPEYVEMVSREIENLLDVG